jgi:hypothetical protein
MFKQTKTLFTLLVIAFICAPACLLAQDSQTASYKNSPEHYFRLEFRVLGVSADGKIQDTRSYDILAASGPKSDWTSSIRSGDRVPVTTTITSGGSNVEYQYIDVGTNIDVEHIESMDQTLRLRVTANISVLAMDAHVLNATPHEPIIRQAKWQSPVIVPIGKPSIIFSSSNNVDKGKIELELTAIPLDK